DEVKRHYEELIKDVNHTESAGGHQGSQYSSSSASSNRNSSWGSANEDQSKCDIDDSKAETNLSSNNTDT
ncbi:hypothetical protein E2562_028895, partial [Oryza meyeriana var. granulata]